MRDRAIILICLVLSIATISFAVEKNGKSGEFHVHRERYDNPPGVPAFSVPGASPAGPVTLGSSTHWQVNVDGAGADIPGDAANEPSIAIDPNNPDRIAIGWRQFDTVTSNFREAGYAYSTNGGQTWTKGVLQNGVFRSDPVLDFDANGNFYYNSLFANLGIYRTDVFKSTDGGQTWGAPVNAYGDDKQWMSIDRAGGMGNGHIYCTWQPQVNGPDTFNRSTNSAASFEVPVLMSNPAIRFGTIAVGPDGAVYVAGVQQSSSSFSVAKSTNADDAMGTPSFSVVSVDLDGAIVGATVGSDPTPNPDGLGGQVWVAADHTNGPTSGNIYVLCSVDPPGPDPLDVHFVRSEDGGTTWSSPVRINDDTTEFGDWQWFGTMSVAPNGRIDVVWNDTRNGLNSYMSQLMYAFSTDGGRAWSPNIPVSPLWDSRLGWPGIGVDQQQKIGDYYHMISDDEGVGVAWAATFNGEQNVYYTRLVPGLYVTSPSSGIPITSADYFEVSWVRSNAQITSTQIYFSDDDGATWVALTGPFDADGSKLVLAPFVSNTSFARVKVEVETSPGVIESGVSERFTVWNTELFKAGDTFYGDAFGSAPDPPEVGGYCASLLLNCVSGTPDPTEFTVINDNFDSFAYSRRGLKTLECNKDGSPPGFALFYDMRPLGITNDFVIEYETYFGTVNTTGYFSQALVVLDNPCLPFSSCPSYNSISLLWSNTGDLLIRRSPPPGFLDPEIIDTGVNWMPSPYTDFPFVVQWHFTTYGQIYIWFGYRYPGTDLLIGETVYDGYYPAGGNFQKFSIAADNVTTTKQYLNYFIVTDTDNVPAGIRPPPITSSGFKLLPASPNPFASNTVLAYQLDRSEVADLAVYDVAGRRIRTLLQKEAQGAGLQNVVWDGRNDKGTRVPTGIYFYRLQTKNFAATGRVVFIK